MRTDCQTRCSVTVISVKLSHQDDFVRSTTHVDIPRVEQQQPSLANDDDNNNNNKIRFKK